MVILGFHSASAEYAASGLAPELAPLAARYQADLAALAGTRDKAVTQFQQSYLTALTAAEQRATAGNKADELRAIVEEKVAVTAGRAVASVASPLLPLGLASARAGLLRETARVAHEYGVRAQQVAAEYL